MFRTASLILATAALCSTAAVAGDARSIALGGSAIANPGGVHGALENPASMMRMKRQGEKVHFRFGGSLEIRDTGSAIDTLTDEANENLITDIEREIDILATRTVECNPLIDSGDTVCVTGTQAVSDLSAQLLDILDIVDEESIDVQATGDFGMAFTQTQYPVAVHLRFQGTGSGEPAIADGDRDYISEFQTLLDNDSLTLEEAQSTSFLQADEFGIPLGVTLPEDVLTSEAQGSALLRTQLGISFASTVAVGGILVDLGITPKFSSLRAYNEVVRVSEEFEDGTESIADRFEDSEVSESSFTFDAGATLQLSNLPVTVAAVLRNIIPESITTKNNFEFETTPQLIVGAAMQRGSFSFTGDLALNEAKVDNFETQKIGLGVEFNHRWLALRSGLSVDSARSTDSTALSLGFGLGPVHFGARVTGTESAEASFQISHSFR